MVNNLTKSKTNFLY